MEPAERVRVENLERAVANLADALEESIKLHGMGWTHWRGKALQAKVQAAKALVGEPPITLTDEPAGAGTQPRTAG